MQIKRSTLEAVEDKTWMWSRKCGVMQFLFWSVSGEYFENSSACSNTAYALWSIEKHSMIKVLESSKFYLTFAKQPPT
jgi:hypothetical protein